MAWGSLTLKEPTQFVSMFVCLFCGGGGGSDFSVCFCELGFEMRLALTHGNPAPAFQVLGLLAYATLYFYGEKVNRYDWIWNTPQL